MPIRKYTIDPPFAHQAGDKYFAVGYAIEHERASVVIASRTYAYHFTLNRTELTEVVGGPNIDRFYWEYHMPGVAVTLTSVEIEQPSGAYTYKFSNGAENSYPSRALAIAAVEDIDTTDLTARKMAVLTSLRQDQNGANANVMVGRSFTIDGASATPMSVSPAVVGGSA